MNADIFEVQKNGVILFMLHLDEQTLHVCRTRKITREKGKRTSEIDIST